MQSAGRAILSALGVLYEGDIIWFWIGPHDEYDRLLKRI